MAVLEVEDDLEAEPDLPRPRLSLPLDEDEEEDSSVQIPPEDIAMHIEDENLTQRSVEMARRAANDPPGSRFARVSFGSIRFSDRFADVDQLKAAQSSEHDPNDEEEEDDDVSDGDGDRNNNEFDEGNLTDEEDEDDIILKYVQRMTPSRGERALTSSPTSSDESTAMLQETPSQAPAEQGDTGLLPPPEDMDDPTFALPIPQTDHDMPALLEPQLMEDDEESDEDTVEPTGLQKPERYEHEIGDDTIEPMAVEKTARPRPNRVLKVSKHGTPYPSLPAGVVKRLATTLAPPTRRGKAQISKETLGALIEASDCFFEQVGDDLEAYAKHAGRNTIDERDMITLMKR